MNNRTRKLIGSPSRDVFKWLHKELFPGDFYGCDIDFLLIDFELGIVAILDYKENEDIITTTEQKAYDGFINLTFKVFIVRNQQSYRLGKLENLIKASAEADINVEHLITQKGLEILKKAKVYRYSKQDGKINLELVSNNYIEWEYSFRMSQKDTEMPQIGSRND